MLKTFPQYTVVFCEFLPSAGASQEVERHFDSHPQAIVGTGEGYPNNNKNKHSSRLIKSFRRIDGELISWHKPVAV